MSNDAHRTGAAGAQVLGRYELVSEIAKSQLGALWVAHSGQDIVCVRRIPKTGVSDAERDWLSEVGWWALELRHPNIATTLDVVMTDAEMGVVAAYTEGEPLRSLLRLAAFKRRPVPAPIALRILLDVSEAAAYTGSHPDRPSFGGRYAAGGLVPDSAIVGSDGVTRLLDAGVAGVIARIDSMARHPEMVAYAAPELLAGQDVDRRADVFSVGIMLWEMLAGRRLFVGATHAAVAERVKSLEVPRLDASKPIGGEPIAATVADLVARSLARDPAARYDGASDLVAALHALGPDAIAAREGVKAFLEDLAGSQLGVRRKAIEKKVGRSGATPQAPSVRTPQPARVMPAQPAPARAPQRTLLGMQPVRPKIDSGVRPDVLDDTGDDEGPVSVALQSIEEPSGDRDTPEPSTLDRPTPAPSTLDRPTLERAALEIERRGELQPVESIPAEPVADSELIESIPPQPGPPTFDPPTLPTAKPFQNQMSGLPARTPGEARAAANAIDIPAPPAAVLELPEPIAPPPLPGEAERPRPVERNERAERAIPEPGPAPLEVPGPAPTRPLIGASAPEATGKVELALDVDARLPADALERRKRARRLVASAIGGLLVLLVGGIVVSALKKPRESTEARTASAAAVAPPPPAAATAEPSTTATEPSPAAAEPSAAPPSAEPSASAVPVASAAPEPVPTPEKVAENPPVAAPTRALAPTPPVAPRQAPATKPKPKPKPKFTPSGI